VSAYRVGRFCKYFFGIFYVLFDKENLDICKRGELFALTVGVTSQKAAAAGTAKLPYTRPIRYELHVTP